MPVIMSGKRGGSSADSSGSGAGLKATIPTPVFVVAILVVVLAVAVIAYRMFGPQDGGWDNTREGTPPSASSLMAPPPPPRSGDTGGVQHDASQPPVGAELPPDIR